MREERSSLLGGGANAKYGLSPSSPPTATTPASSPHANIVGCTTPLTPTINTRRRSSIAAMAAAADAKARRKSSVQMKTLPPAFPYNNIPKPLIEVPSMESLDSLEVDEAVKQRMNNNADTNNRQSSSASSSCGNDNDLLKIIHKIISQLPAIAIASVLNFMVCSERVFQYISCAISFSIRLLFFFCCTYRLAYHSGHPTSQQNYHYYQARKYWVYVCSFSQHW